MLKQTASEILAKSKQCQCAVQYYLPTGGTYLLEWSS